MWKIKIQNGYIQIFTNNKNNCNKYMKKNKTLNKILLRKRLRAKINAKLKANNLKIIPINSLSTKINKLIIPNLKINWYNPNIKKYNIEMTVALPVFNSPKILYLALESLKNQINVPCQWELIIVEENGVNHDLITKYLGVLPNCVRISYYPIEQRILLIEKWKYIGLMASNTSKVYVLHAADDYSPPKRLYIHYKHLKNKRCQFSTQPKGVFYNVNNKKIIFYDGNIQNKKNRKRLNHLNMAIRTSTIKTIPIKPIKKGVDGYIRRYTMKKYKIKPNQRYIFNDDAIDKNNWKYGFFTDGMNNISFSRKRFYIRPRKQFRPYIQRKKYGYLGIQHYIPKYILTFLANVKK